MSISHKDVDDKIKLNSMHMPPAQKLIRKWKQDYLRLMLTNLTRDRKIYKVCRVIITHQLNGTNAKVKKTGE